MTEKHFNWRAFDAYLFDIDGTLLNSRDAVHYFAFQRAVRSVYGCEPRLEGVQVQGSTDVRIMRDMTRLAGISEDEFRAKLPQAIAEICANVERNQHDLKPELCPSILDLLEQFHSAGRLLGVTSGNLEPIGWAKLRAAGVRHYFQFGSFSDRNETREEIFRWGAKKVREILGPAARLCFVGDTPADVLAAKAVGEPIMAVATGVFSVDELTEHGPEMCLSCLDALESRP
ncbi:MAG TPA: HAD family hydrolase [candidate division Zixibacteria bacterium]|nr:HAD family hydrolase [candidate division Zixibacteria bacterium]